jgi:pyruvate dehydrogenase (quinone)
VVLNNESLAFVNIEQQEAGIVPFGTKFRNPNFARVAEAMGAKGIRLEEPGGVRDAISEALAYKAGPVVVDAVVDPLALSLPSHVPFHTIKGFTLSLAKQVVSGRLDDVIKTMEDNVRLV